MTPNTARFAKCAPIAVALILAACSAQPSPSASTTAGGGGGGTTVKATLTEFKVELDKTEIPSGDVTFEVTNNGTITHEFVVFKTDDAADALPKASDENAVNEDDSTLTSMGEVEDLEKGATKSFGATLEPGSYVAICNVVDHYMAGMQIPFMVK